MLKSLNDFVKLVCFKKAGVMRHKYPGEERQRLTTQLNTSARTLVLTQDLKETQYLTLRNVKERAFMSEEVQERERNLANLITPLHN